MDLGFEQPIRVQLPGCDWLPLFGQPDSNNRHFIGCHYPAHQ